MVFRVINAFNSFFSPKWFWLRGKFLITQSVLMTCKCGRSCVDVFICFASSEWSFLQFSFKKLLFHCGGSFKLWKLVCFHCIKLFYLERSRKIGFLMMWPPLTTQREERGRRNKIVTDSVAQKNASHFQHLHPSQWLTETAREWRVTGSRANMNSFDLSSTLQEEKKAFLISINTAIISIHWKIACCLVCSFISFL